MTGEVVAVCRSEHKGEKKTPLEQGWFKVDFGLEGDAHGGNWHRQVSLLAIESIDKMRAKGLELNPGDFAENITTRGLDLPGLPIGTRLSLSGGTILEVTQIGKECHVGCAIYEQVGECVMPTEGIFAIVIQPGPVQAGDTIEVVAND